MTFDRLVDQGKGVAMTTSTIASIAERVDAVVAAHPVVTSNRYTAWFARGEATDAEVRHLTVQFSVFSHLFVEAQLRKCINATSLETYRAGKEILLNELGVSFADDGSVDGGRFRFGAAHFEWLLRFGAALDLPFEALGKPSAATPSTRHFCDELLRIYGSEDPSTAEGASYAVEHWAAAGFWKELIAGLEGRGLPMGFWTWHDRVEDQHAGHTTDELAVAAGQPWFDEDRFVAAASEMLDGVAVFWDGLWDDHLASASCSTSLS
jgi:hypothetical protein